MMGKPVLFERADVKLKGRTPVQTREDSRELRRIGHWPRDNTGGGRASTDVKLEQAVSRILATGAPSLPKIGPLLDALDHIRCRGIQHEPVTVLPSRIEGLLSSLAVDDQKAKPRQFIRGADLTLPETIAHMLTAIAANPAIADQAEAVAMELELLDLPPPFDHRAMFWLYENGTRYGWEYKNPSLSDATTQHVTGKVLVRSVKIPSPWFREYADLWANKRSYPREIAA